MIPTVVVLADYAGTLDVANRTEVRTRVTQGSQTNPGVDFSDNPSARLGLRDRSWEHTLEYSPLLLLPDVELGSPPLLLQTGDASTTWHNRWVQLGLSEFGAYGEENSAFLPTAPAGAPGTPITVQALPQPITLFYGYSDTSLTSRLRVARRWVASTSLDYVLQGGLTQSSRLVTPLLEGPRATATLGYTATRVDTVETRASGLVSQSTAAPCGATVIPFLPPGGSTTCAARTDTAQAAEVWRHRFARRTEASIGAGAAVVHVKQRPEDRFTNIVYPVATASFEHGRTIEAQRALLRIDAQLAPIIDVLTGTADYRAQGSVNASLPIEHATLRGSLAATRSVQSRFFQPVTFASGQADIDYRFTRYLSAGGGFRAAYQEQQPFGSFWTGMLFVEATVRMPSVRF
jgi:hypothetical protein